MMLVIMFLTCSSKGGIHESTIHGKSAKRKSMISSTTTTEDMILSRRHKRSTRASWLIRIWLISQCIICQWLIANAYSRQAF
jgi:hypothetical protein